MRRHGGFICPSNSALLARIGVAAVFLVVIATALIGLIIGATFRVPALLAASAVAAIAGLVVALVECQSVLWACLFALACIAVLQASCLVGLFGFQGLRHLAGRR